MDMKERMLLNTVLSFKLEELDRKCIYEGHTPCLAEGERPLIHVHHDESTFYAGLGSYPNFKTPKTLIEELVEKRGHICMFFAKFHCELNAIERCLCHDKKYCRQYANGSIVRLRKIIPESVETCTPDLIGKFFKTCRDYMRAYRGGYDCTNVDAAVKVYKSHRRVSVADN